MKKTAEQGQQQKGMLDLEAAEYGEELVSFLAAAFEMTVGDQTPVQAPASALEAKGLVQS